MRKYLLIFAVPFTGAVIGGLLFNHINPWLGFAVFIATFIYSLNLLIKNIKNESND